MDKGIRKIIWQVAIKCHQRGLAEYGDVISEIELEEAISEIRKLVMECVPQVKKCDKAILACVRCESCDTNSYNSAIADITKNLEEIWE